jgi:SRSO17 transposase
MTPAELARARRRLVAFAAEMLEPLARADQRRWGECYLRGLMLDGKRKSIQPMAERLPDGNEQALQQFVSQSPWDWRPVRQRLAQQLTAAVDPDAWIIDDTGFPKFGTASVGVARKYSGTLGKVANCQIGVSIHAATDQASCPIDWRLFCPRAGIRMLSGDAPRTCPSRFGIDPSGSWCWTWWMSLPSGGLPRRWWPPMPAMGSRASCAWAWRRAGWPM